MKLKRFISALLCLMLALTLTPTATVTARADGAAWTGSGTQADPWNIFNADDLRKLADSVNGGNSHEGEWFCLRRDIDLGGTNWTPIGNYDSGTGTNRQFAGTFLGLGRSITGLKAQGGDSMGLFGYLTGTLRNLSVYGSVKGGSYVGGIVGCSKGHILYCDFAGSVIGRSETGGIAGHNTGIIENCVSTATVTGPAEAGGICGYNFGTVKNCTNNGPVTGSGQELIYDDSQEEDDWKPPEDSGNIISNDIGGITGRNDGTVSGCLNDENGVVSCDGYFCGGIAGLLHGTIENCTNKALLNVCVFSGGIAGEIFSGSKITGCLNSGDVDGRGKKMFGGIAGRPENDCVIENCTNTGTIFNGAIMGGIVGKASRGVLISGCLNKGDVTGSEKSYQNGGICGFNYGTVSECTNRGNISGGTKVGGITGINCSYSSDLPAEVKSCVNYGKVSAKQVAGGITGDNLSNCTVSGCRSFVLTGFGVYAVNADEYAGGIVGDNSSGASVLRCKNNSSVKCADGPAGGIAGRSDGTLSLCVNESRVMGKEDVGGIAGRAVSVEKCRNSGRVDADQYAGGIVGFIKDKGSKVSQCCNTGKVTVSGNYVGGIVGDIRAGGIENCCDRGIVWGYNYVGGIAGSTQGDNAKYVKNCYVKAPEDNDSESGERGIDCDFETVLFGEIAQCGALIGNCSDSTEMYHNFWWVPCSTRALGSRTLKPHSDGDEYDYLEEDSFGKPEKFTKWDWDFEDIWEIGKDDDGKKVPVFRWEVGFTIEPEGGVGGDGGSGGIGNSKQILSLRGIGTEESPYLISDIFDWRDLAAYTKAGGVTSGLYFLQTHTFTADTMLSSNEHPFEGNYNGGGNMLAFFETNVPEEFAPFCDIRNATIKNLHISGTIDTKNRWTAGLAVDAFGTCLIQNCRSSLSINSDIASREDGDGTHSAFICVSQKDSDVTFEGCSAEGWYTLPDGGKTNFCGGFVGFVRSKVAFTDCVFFPAKFQWGNSQNFCRLADEARMEMSNSFYMENAANDQGVRGRSVTAEEKVELDFGSPSVEYAVSRIKAYPAGLEYNGTFYSGSDASVELGISSTVPGAHFSAGAGSLIEGSEGRYTLVMPDSDVSIGLDMPQEATPAAGFRATGADTGVLSGLESGAAYKLTGVKEESFTASGTEKSLTGLAEGELDIVRAGGTATYDSDPQTIKIGKAETPGLTAVQPGNGVPTGSIPTGPEHEISTDGTDWVACTGVSSGLAPGTYSVRVAAAGSVLASEAQVIVLEKAFTVEIKPGAHMTRDASSGSLKQEGLDGAMAEVVFTADQGYCFPIDYAADTAWGITVKRSSAETISISGTPSDDVAVTLPDASPRPVITFRANGAKGSMGPQTVVSGVKTPLEANSFTYEGHAFVCWNTKADGTGKGYADRQEVTLTKNLTLYAIWEETTTKILDVKVDGAPAGGAIPEGDISVSVTLRLEPALKGENVRAAVWCFSPEGRLLWYRLVTPAAAEGSNIYLAQVKGTGTGAGSLRAALMYTAGWTPLCEAAEYR